MLHVYAIGRRACATDFSFGKCNNIFHNMTIINKCSLKSVSLLKNNEKGIIYQHAYIELTQAYISEAVILQHQSHHLFLVISTLMFINTFIPTLSPNIADIGKTS